MKPAVSVVIVSDYQAGLDRGWELLRKTLTGLAGQEFSRPVEFLLVESASLAEDIPEDLTCLLPGLRIMLADATSSCALKNEGAQAAQADIVAVLDGDCVPDPRWLRALVDALETRPDAAAVSGRTVNQAKSPWGRICGLLDRGYLDRGHPAETYSIANNNAGFRRCALRRHPFIDQAGAFGGKLQAESMRRSGLKLLFEPGMLVTHAFGGWEMEKDIRRNAGYATLIVRRIDRQIPFAGMARLGYLSIPLFVAARTAYSGWLLIRLWPYYLIERRHLPLGFLLAVYLPLLEIPGMVAAVRDRAIQVTAYR